MKLPRYRFFGKMMTCAELAKVAGVKYPTMEKRLLAIGAKPGNTLPVSVVQKKATGALYVLEKEKGVLTDIAVGDIAKTTRLSRNDVVKKLSELGIHLRGRVTCDIIKILSLSAKSEQAIKDDFKELKPTPYNLRYVPRDEPYKNGSVCGQSLNLFKR